MSVDGIRKEPWCTKDVPLLDATDVHLVWQLCDRGHGYNKHEAYPSNLDVRN